MCNRSNYVLCFLLLYVYVCLLWQKYSDINVFYYYYVLSIIESLYPAGQNNRVSGQMYIEHPITTLYQNYDSVV